MPNSVGVYGTFYRPTTVRGGARDYGYGKLTDPSSKRPLQLLADVRRWLFF